MSSGSRRVRDDHFPIITTFKSAAFPPKLVIPTVGVRGERTSQPFLPSVHIFFTMSLYDDRPSPPWLFRQPYTSVVPTEEFNKSDMPHLVYNSTIEYLSDRFLS